MDETPLFLPPLILKILKEKQNKKETGAILFLSLMILMVMTIIGIATFDSSVIEQKIANNTVNITESNFANDLAYRTAVFWLDSLLDAPKTCTTPPCCQGCVWKEKALTTEPAKQNACWWRGKGTPGCSSGPANGISINGAPYIAYNAQYVIENYGCDAGLKERYFRITTRAVGLTDPPVTIKTQVYASSLRPPPKTFWFEPGTTMPRQNVQGVRDTLVNFQESGNIVGLWIGFVDYDIDSGSDATVTLSVLGKPTVEHRLNFTPVKNAPSNDSQRTLRGYAALPTPYAISRGDNLTITVILNTPLGGFFTKGIIKPGNIAEGPFKITIDGITNFCQLQ